MQNVTETGPPPSFQPESFGKYYLIDKIAVGGMAEVFRAKSFSTGGFEKLLVIKRILQHLSANNEFVEMFIDEAKISVLLQQPNIVQTYDFGRIRDNYFIAMECVEGKDLKGILRKLSERRKLLPTEYAVYITHEVCKGLDYAHKKTNLKGEPLGIVHRDMSPSNILVSYTGEVKIADFGIAKAEISIFNTKDGVLKGKFEYMSPEQASGLDIDARSDIFSVGIMLHEMLTGRRLFKTDSEIKTLERIRLGDVKPPSSVNPNIPARLDEIVLRALARDRADRFQDAKEMQAELLEFMYPATPDLTRESLSHFMQQVFEEEIGQERHALEEGTRMAAAMWEEEPELEPDAVWNEAGPSSGTLQTPPSRIPIVVAVLAILLAIGAVAWFATRPEPAVVERVVEVAAPLPTHGSLEIRITPSVEATIKLGEQEIGKGPHLIFDKVPPDTPAELKVEAEGYETVTDTVTISAGERLRLPVTLRAVAPPATTTTTGGTTTARQASNAPPSLVISSVPSGASVTLDGASIGKTPITWDKGTVGTRYTIQLSLSGYQTQSFAVAFPENGRESVSRQLKALASEEPPGKVSVNVSQGWAEVWIDGKKIETTPLYNYELSTGSHQIRVVNPSTGYEDTQTVRVVSGKTERVSFEVK